MNGLNESDVTKVTCVTNVTNEFDETRFFYVAFQVNGLLFLMI